MATYRFPVVLWQDAGKQFCACSIEFPSEAAAVGPTRSHVLDQLKDYFTWTYRNVPWRDGPEYKDATLTQFRVQVRPEYLHDKRLYSSDPVGLRVSCVHGKLDSGLYYGAIPMLGVSFNFHSGDKLRDTVTHYTQQALKGRALEEIVRFMPDVPIEIDEVIIQIPRSRRPSLDLPAVKTLDATADPISSRQFKSGLSRPWQREDDVARLADFLSKEKKSLILMGPAAAGKSSILVEAARKVQLATPAPEDDPDLPAGKAPPRIWMTSGARIVAGMQYLGQWQERCDNLIAELTEIRGVLCVDRLLDLVSGGADDPSGSIGAYFVPFILRGELRLIAEATAEELDTCRRLLPSLVDACQIMTISSMTRTQATAALEQIGKYHAQNGRVTLEPSAIPLVYRLFNRFQPYQAMPGPAANFIAELFDDALSKKESRIDHNSVYQGFIRRTGLPEWLLRDELPLQRDDVLASLHRDIIGQDAACSATADVILTFKAGMQDPRRPLAVMLFVGPTGVGKTGLAKALSRYLFGHGADTNRLVRLDMSEYSGPGAATRFLGTPRGEPSALIQRIRQQPFSVVLLDEIEKASAEVFDLLLGLFDEGRLTDRLGRLTTFRSSILIMTSNLGGVHESFGFAPSSARTAESEIAAFFRPEFFNRIDNVVTFHGLTAGSMRAIAEKDLREIAARDGLAQRRISLSWSPEVIEHLIRVGFDPRYGARPLQRAIETEIVTPMAKLISTSNMMDCTLHVKVHNGAIALERVTCP